MLRRLKVGVAIDMRIGRTQMEKQILGGVLFCAMFASIVNLK